MKTLKTFLRDRRPWLPALAVAGTALAIYGVWHGPENKRERQPKAPPAQVASPPPRPGAASPAGPPPAATETAPPSPSVESAPAQVDIFAVRDWEPPPPPPPPPEAAPPPPPPQAPPLPYHYLGRVEETGKATVFFLLRDERVIAARSGEVIDGQYRLGKLEGTQLQFLYQPMNIQQSLTVEHGS